MKYALKKRWLLGAVLGLALAAVGSASPAAAASSSSNRTFILIRHGLPSDSFWQPVQKGFTEAGKLYGDKTIFEATGNVPAKEAQAIDAAIAQKVNGIVVTLPDAGAEGPAIKRAVAAGIPVITINSGSTTFLSAGSLAHVGQDEEIAGEGAGARLKQAGAKHLLCVIHQQGNLALEARCNGAKKTFGGRVDDLYVPGTNDGSATESTIKAALLRDRSYDAVLTLDPDISQFAKDAIAAAHSTARLATFDLSDAVLRDIKNGKILFAVNQQPYLQGYLPVVLLQMYLDNGLLAGGGKPILTGPSFVDQKNVDEISACVKRGDC
ncbi:MAG: substrate-binding domain-containing protein [Acetobacteraceae bacterium]